MGERCDKCKNNNMSAQLILGYMICTQCAEELRRMVSNWVNAAAPVVDRDFPAPKRRASP